MKNTDAPNPPSLLLENDALKVEIAAPQAYPGTRFGKGAFITQITCRLGGTAHTFCANELETDGTGAPYHGGSGLCHEFGIFKAVGYTDAQVGEWFPKIDTGLLRRHKPGKYDFFESFEIQPFPFTVEQDEQELRITAQPIPARGYAVQFQQTLRLDRNRLRIACRLENHGTQPVATDEYRHNFLAFDGRGPEPGLRLRVPFAIAAKVFPEETGTVTQKNGLSEIAWNQPPDPHFFREVLTPEPATWWEMEWPGAPVGIREETSVPMAEFHLFATPRLISPEAFLNIELPPGKTLDWERIYTFYPVNPQS